MYSKNWYISNYEERNKFDEFWNSFEIEVERARCKNLINNPIILILALVIFDCENRLPTRRIEFYEKCIKTFLTERELHRKAFVLSEKAKSILVMNLTLPKVAYYKFKKLKEDVGYKFNSDELINAINNAIEITDDIEWNAPVNQYSQYLIMRTELIHEIDENTFDFAHKTFFEYFLSIYFSKTSTTTTLISLLKEWIGDANYDELARLIVEVVIQNNDQRQVDAVMQYLFNALDRKTYINNIESRRILDVFCLLADLYEHNLIPPKYHKQYNQFILYNPQYIERVERNLIVWGERRKINRIKYDERCIAIDFCKELEANNLPDVVNSIIFLNNEYQRCLLELNSNPLLYHINSLFSLNRRQIHKSEEKNRKEYKIRELNYFLNDALSFTLSTPQIFLAILSIAIDIECYDCIDVLLNYSFKPNDETYLHIDPNTLIKLIKLSKESKAAFSLLLIVLTECLYEKTNSMFRFLFKVRIKGREPSGTLTEGDKTLLIKLWRSLNNSETFEDFRDAINNLNLYDASYDRIYNRTFSTYINYSKGIGDEEIEKYINDHEPLPIE